MSQRRGESEREARLCRGKRQGVYGSYLLAVYNPDDESFETISKIGTGFSDEQLTQLSTLLNGHIIPAPLPYYRSGRTFLLMKPLQCSLCRSACTASGGGRQSSRARRVV